MTPAPFYSGPQDDIAAILAAVREWDSAIRAGDHAVLLDLVTEDCVFLAPGLPPLQGRECLAPQLAGFSLFRVDPVFEIQEIVVTGDWAFVWAKDEITATPISGGDPRSAKGWALSILQKGPDQRWRFARGANTKTESKEPLAPAEPVGGSSVPLARSPASRVNPAPRRRGAGYTPPGR